MTNRKKEIEKIVFDDVSPDGQRHTKWEWAKNSTKVDQLLTLQDQAVKEVFEDIENILDDLDEDGSLWLVQERVAKLKQNKVKRK